MVLSSLEQICERDAEGLGYGEQLVDGRVGDAFFDFAEITLVDFGHERKSALRQILTLALFGDRASDRFSFGQKFHGARLR